MNLDGGAQDGAASPVRNVEDVENSLLRETLQEIQTYFPDFLDALTDNDREALFNIQTESRDELRNILPDFRRIIAARNSYVDGFVEGMRRLMAEISDHLMDYSDELDHQMISISPGTSINDEELIHDSRENHIFWDTPKLIEFDSDTRPLSWCNEVRSSELLEEPEDKRNRTFHGHPLVTKLAVSYEIPVIEQSGGCDPRLPFCYYGP